MSIDLLQRALDYVRFYNPEKDQEIRAKLHKDLQAALAKQEQIHTSVSANTHQCEQEPVAWAVELPDGTRKPLYTHPARQPLTDEEIEKLRHLIDWTAEWSYNTFARAIEAAHGIKGKA